MPSKPTLYDVAKAFVNAIDHYETMVDDPWGEAGADHAEDELVEFILKRYGGQPEGALELLLANPDDATYDYDM